MNTLLNFLAAAILAFVIGVGGTLYALTAKRGVQHVDKPPWHSTIEVTPEGTNPYVRAVLARTGEVPMLSTEAIVFRAVEDDEGNALRTDCDYRLDGNWMDARWWTITVGERDRNAPAQVEQAAGRYALNSGEIVRDAAGDYTIRLARAAKAGNWISLEGLDRPAVTLRLYDTPLYVNGGLPELELPDVVREACS